MQQQNTYHKKKRREEKKGAHNFHNRTLLNSNNIQKKIPHFRFQVADLGRGQNHLLFYLNDLCCYFMEFFLFCNTKQKQKELRFDNINSENEKNKGNLLFVITIQNHFISILNFKGKEEKREKRKKWVKNNIKYKK